MLLWLAFFKVHSLSDQLGYKTLDLQRVWCWCCPLCLCRTFSLSFSSFSRVPRLLLLASSTLPSSLYWLLLCVSCLLAGRPLPRWHVTRASGERFCSGASPWIVQRAENDALCSEKLQVAFARFVKQDPVAPKERVWITARWFERAAVWM